MGQSPYSSLVLIALMVFAFYFLIIRPNKKRQLAQQQTMNSLTTGTRVLLTSGIYGTIVQIGEKQAVIELSPNAHLTVLKPAIARVVTEFDSVDDDYELGTADDADVLSADQRPAGTLTADNDVDSPSPWSNDGSHSIGTDKDPRSGTNTTPIKD